MYKRQEALAEGFARPGARRKPEEFEVLPLAMVVINDDLEAAADALRPMLALYIGGMGAKEANFHFDVFVRMGYEAEAHRIQDLYLAGDKAAAIAAVPATMIEEIALIGPKDKIRDDLAAWQESRVTTMLLGNFDPATLQTMAELVL